MKYIWLIWCVVWLAVLIILLFPVLVIIVYSGSSSSDYYGNRLVSFGARIALFMWGIRVVQHNRKLIREDQPYVYVANHRSDLDGIVTYSILKGSFKFIGKTQILSWPFFGFLVGKLHLTVDRTSDESRKRSLRNLVKAVEKGDSIMVHAEGWCNFSDNYVLPLRKGAFRAAVETQAPIAVYTMVGNGDIWPKTTLRIRPGTVHVYWEQLIETTGMTEADEPELMRQVTAIWEDRLRAAYPEGYATPGLKRSFEEWQSDQLNGKGK